MIGMTLASKDGCKTILMEQSMNSVHARPSSVVPFRERTGPGPDVLPGIEGFYVLSPRGKLGRYCEDGRFSEEPALTRALAPKIEELLGRYRDQDAESPVIGLVTRNGGDQPWGVATLILSDDALRDVFSTGNERGAPLTAFQKRNKIKSVYRGMELLLDTEKSSQPGHPRFCPVLFAPEVGGGMLRRRHDVERVDTGDTLEVLDLLAAFNPAEHRAPAVSHMVETMRESGITPELRRPSELMLVDDADATGPFGAGASAPVEESSQADPWAYLTEERNICFNDGDAVPYWLLGWFAPFDGLNDLQRQFVARGLTVEKKRAGTTLIEIGSEEDKCVYLVEGTLELEAFDGRVTTVVGGTRHAHLPLSQLHPHAFTVRAASDVTVVFVRQSLVREINRVNSAYRGIEATEATSFPGNVTSLVAAAGDDG